MPERHPLLAQLPDLINARIRALDISQSQLAEDLGLSVSTVTRLVQGKLVYADTVLNVIQWLQLSPDWLLAPQSAADAYTRGRRDAIDLAQAAWRTRNPVLE